MESIPYIPGNKSNRGERKHKGVQILSLVVSYLAIPTPVFSSFHLNAGKRFIPLRATTCPTIASGPQGLHKKSVGHSSSGHVLQGIANSARQPLDLPIGITLLECSSTSTCSSQQNRPRKQQSLRLSSDSLLSTCRLCNVDTTSSRIYRTNVHSSCHAIGTREPVQKSGTASAAAAPIQSQPTRAPPGPYRHLNLSVGKT